MSNQMEIPNLSKQSIFEWKPLEVISLLVAFGTVVSALYLFGFWSTFEINILQFISIADILKLGIYPAVFGLMSFTIGAIIGTILPQNETKAVNKEKKEISKSERINSFVEKHFNKVFIIAQLIFILILFFAKDSYVWIAGAILFTFVITLIVKEPKILEKLIPNSKVRGFLFFILIGFNLLSFAVGKRDAYNILEAKSVKVINPKIFKEYGSEALKKKGLFEGEETLKFIGIAGDYYFFIKMDNSKIYTVKYSDLHFLELIPYVKPKQ